MSRLKVLSYDDMTPEQQGLHDEILDGPRNQIGGPMNAWFRSPELGSLSQKLGAFCRFRTSLPPVLSELAILVVARYWSQPVEWWSHHPIALDAGLDPDIATTILRGEAPTIDDAKAQAVYQATTEILNTRQLSSETYQRALGLFGEQTLFELTAIIGYYSNIAIQMNCFAVTVPEGETNPFAEST